MGVIDFLLALAQDMLLAAIPAVGFAVVALVSGASQGVHRRRRDPDVPGHICVYGDDFRGENQPFWLH